MTPRPVPAFIPLCAYYINKLKNRAITNNYVVVYYVIQKEGLTVDNTLRVRSIRATDEIYERFKSLASEFSNQSEALSSMVAAWEVQQAKAVITERKTEISDFGSHLQAIQAAFLHSLELNENAENRIRQEFRSMLESKDKTIVDLQARLEQAEAAARDAESRANDAEAATATAMDKLDAETAARQTAEKTAQAAEAATADKEKIIASLTRQLTAAEEASDRIAAAENQAYTALEEAREAKATATQANNALALAQAEAELATERAEIEKKHAVLDAQQEGQARIGELMEENHRLIKQLAELRAEMRNT